MSRNHTYSQHFLRSPRLVAELIGHSNIRKNDTVYDLGAGSGVIASVLARRCKQVIAVEIEPQALAKLRQNLSHEQNITILKKDILDLDLPKEPYKIFANIPFSVSAQVVRKFTEAQLPPFYQSAERRNRTVVYSTNP
jgi:23S rRNA (adenine-N6)-dimethyltransferase